MDSAAVIIVVVAIVVIVLLLLFSAIRVVQQYHPPPEAAQEKGDPNSYNQEGENLNQCKIMVNAFAVSSAASVRANV